MAIQVTNAGPEADTIHVLPTAWFRNTWSWGDDEPRPALRASGDRSVTIDHPFLGTLELIAAAGPDGADPQLLFCENETNLARLYGADPVTPYPKDGINDHVIHGAATVNPAGTGTKCAFWYQVTVPPGQTAELRLRLRPAAQRAGPGRAASGGGRARRGLRPGDGRAPGRGRRVLRRADPGQRQRGRGAGAAAGVRGHAVEQAAVLLRRGPLAGRRPDPARTAARGAQDRAELQVAQLRRVRHHLDAGQVGVSLVRRLGPGLPHASPWPTWTRRSPSTS